MRLCVSCVYWTLLLVSVVSSGLLFLIVASEDTQISQKPRGISQEDNIPVEDVGKGTDGGYGESQDAKVSEVHPRPTVKTKREHLYPVEHDGGLLVGETSVRDSKSENNLDVLKQSLTQQPNLSQGISESGQAVVLTLVDTAAAELQSLAEPRLSGDTRARSLTKNATLKTTTANAIPVTTTTTTTTTATPTATSISLEQDESNEQAKKTGTSTLPIVPVATESSTNSTRLATSSDETVLDESNSQDNTDEQEIVVVRAEQKVLEDVATRKIEETHEDEVKEESVKQDEPSSTSSELDDGAARARLVVGSGEESTAAILDGLVASGPTDHHHEDIPSFSEWAQKRLEEAEKKKTHPNASIQNPGGPGRGVGGMKVRSKNYASPDCGAKIVAVNPEARSARSVLVSTRDEYMLNTCTSRIWFVVELCEAIQAKKIELANFELFSSSPKDFAVHVSDRFPTRDWSPVGQFTAKDQRDIQSFALHPHLFGKFIKVEFHSHYGSEHFCPISLFRAYGTSEFEVLETETDHQESDNDDDDEDDEDEALDSESGGDARNLFGSARDAVLRIVKKAAEVLVKTGDPSNKNNITKIQESIEDSIKASSFASCTTPRYTINCPNCTDHRFAGVFELLSCRAERLNAILKVPFVNDTLRTSELCSFYDVDTHRSTSSNDQPIVDTSYLPKNGNANVDEESSRTKFHLRRNLRASFLASIYSSEYIYALCNMIATKERGLVLNTSYDVAGNASVNSSTRIDANAGKFESFETNGQARVVTSNCLPETDSNGCKNTGTTRQSKVVKVQGTNIREPEGTPSNSPETVTTSSESLASQIRPTKALSREDMRKESSVPILEPSKDPNEGTVQAEVLTTPSPMMNVATATTRITEEPATIQNSVETTTQIVTPVVVIPNQPPREAQDPVAGQENNGENSPPVKHDNNVQETKPSKSDNGEHEAKMMAQDQITLDSILSDLKDLEGDGSGIHGNANNNANIVAQPTASSTPQQKESVFLRLSNRIKALERNMSLSGQYLEELSKRYKKQVEEMQRSLERATAAMSEEARKGEERDIRRIEEISALRDEISSLTQSLEILLYDRNSWRSKLSTICQHFALIVVEIVLFMFVVSYCRRNSEFEIIDETTPGIATSNEATRRRSAGTMSNCSAKKARKRRPSEIASRIGVTYRDLMIEDRTNHESKKEKRKRRKRELQDRTFVNVGTRKESSRLDEGMPGGTVLPSRRSSSIDSTSNHAKQLELCHTRRRPDSAPEYSGGWVEEPLHKTVIPDITVEDPRLSSDQLSNHQRSSIEEIRPESNEGYESKEDEKITIGPSIFRGGGILKAAKLSSPSFMKTALGSRIKRNSKNSDKIDHVVQLKSDNWEWYSRNSSNKSDSPSSAMLTDTADSGSYDGPGATNGHHRNTSNESESSSTTTTPGSKKDKKTGGGLRKMVRKLF